MVRLNVAGVEDKRASMRRAMPILPSNILECFPLRSFCGGNTTFIFRCHVTSKQPIESMRLHYTIARDALIVKGSLSGVDMRHGEGQSRIWALSVCASRQGMVFQGHDPQGRYHFSVVGIVVRNTISFYSPIFLLFILQISILFFLQYIIVFHFLFCSF